MKYIYADNAATTQPDEEAIEVMLSCMRECYGNPSQPYFFGQKAKSILTDARRIIAECIGADEDEIIFTSGGTEGNNIAIKGIMPGSDRKEIITQPTEHKSVLNACLSLADEGYEIKMLPVSSNGCVSRETLADEISENTAMVSIMSANNETGAVNPIRELCGTAHKFNALFHTDAVQYLGHKDINVHEAGIDILSASAHKFNGPKGIGFLYLKKGTPLRGLFSGGAQEQGIRPGTENVAGAIAMARALKINCLDTEKNEKHLLTLEKTLTDRLSDAGIDFIRNGADNHIAGNMSLSFRKADGEALLHRLDLMGIAVSTGSACNSVETEASYVLKAMAVPEEYINGTIRISFGKYNTTEDALYISDSLINILKDE